MNTKVFWISLLVFVSITGAVIAFQQKNQQKDQGKVIHMTAAEFKDKIFDYSTNAQEWKYKGSLPCVIDFYADWCKPCRMIAPSMDSLAALYAGKLNVYKINIDKEQELAGAFGVSSIPLVLFVPMSGLPTSQGGALEFTQYKQIVEEICFGKKK